MHRHCKEIQLNILLLYRVVDKRFHVKMRLYNSCIRYVYNIYIKTYSYMHILCFLQILESIYRRKKNWKDIENYLVTKWSRQSHS